MEACSRGAASSRRAAGSGLLESVISGRAYMLLISGRVNMSSARGYHSGLLGVCGVGEVQGLITGPCAAGEGVPKILDVVVRPARQA